MYEQEKIVKRIKEKILKNEISDKEFEFAKLNANLFKNIKFKKKRKAKRKCLKECREKTKN